MALASALLLALPGCGGGEDDAANAQAAGAAEDSALPAPERTAGSVTGMPDAPGPGTTPLQSVGGVPGESVDSAGARPAIDPPARDVPAPSVAFQPTQPEVAPIAVAPVDPRTGNALPARAPVPPGQRVVPPAADPDATASTTIVVDVPVQADVDD